MAPELERQSGTRFRVYWRDPSGKVYGKVFARKRDAEAYGREMEGWRSTGVYIDPRLGKVLFRDLYERLMTDGGLSEKTCDTYRWLGHRYVLPAFGDRPVNTITSLDVSLFIGKLKSREVGVFTMRSAYRLLRRVLEMAVKDGRVPNNQAASADVRFPRHERRQPRFLSDEESMALADAIEPRYRALILLLAYVGLRVGEALALRVEQVDLARRRIRIDRGRLGCRGAPGGGHDEDW